MVRVEDEDTDGGEKVAAAGVDDRVLHGHVVRLLGVRRPLFRSGRS